jgi:glyoxylase-like metal-dependent hydrolase (beta-lactamase superfamily II)
MRRITLSARCSIRQRSAAGTVIGLWLTHGHFDHLADHAVVTSRFLNAKVLIHKLDEPKLQRPEIIDVPVAVRDPAALGGCAR